MFSDELNRVKRSPSFISKIKDTFGAINNVQWHDWIENFRENANETKNTIAETAKKVVNYFR